MDEMRWATAGAFRGLDTRNAHRVPLTSPQGPQTTGVSKIEAPAWELTMHIAKVVCQCLCDGSELRSPKMEELGGASVRPADPALQCS